MTEGRTGIKEEAATGAQRKSFERSARPVTVSTAAARLHAAMVAMADAAGVVHGQSRRMLAVTSGISYWNIKRAIDELSDLGIVAFEPGGSTLFPSWRLSLDAAVEPEARPQADWELSAAERRAANRASCNRALARLLMVHGDNPPDAEAAAAVARIRKGLSGVLTAGAGA